MFKWFRKAESKADAYLNEFIHHLLNAKDAAERAVEHAAKTIAVHEAALVFHHGARAAAADLHNEAKVAVEDVAKALGHDVVPAVEAAAVATVEDAVK